MVYLGVFVVSFDSDEMRMARIVHFILPLLKFFCICSDVAGIEWASASNQLCEKVSQKNQGSSEH